MSTPNECNDSNFSQSACGFVVEFTDIIAKHFMNDTNTNVGGWLASDIYKFLNDDSDSNSIINALDEELRNVIKSTITVSGRGSEDTDNFTSPIDNPDKLYLLSTAEIWADATIESNVIKSDTARDKTRQLDYYKNLNVTVDDNKDKAIKRNNEGTETVWRLRSAVASSNILFITVYYTGEWYNFGLSTSSFGVSPAFRIG